ncbi:MAG: hypothetical protein ABIH23_20125 [bacterium]
MAATDKEIRMYVLIGFLAGLFIGYCIFYTPEEPPFVGGYRGSISVRPHGRDWYYVYEMADKSFTGDVEYEYVRRQRVIKLE